MRASRSVSVSLIISFIAMFMCGDLFTNEAAADCGGLTIAFQIGFGYLAGGATLLALCAAGAYEYEKYETASVAIFAPPAYVLASAGAVYSIGQRAGCRGSFMGTLGGVVAFPIAGGIIGGILGGIWKNDEFAGCLVGSSSGFLLAPISATIAYHLTKEENNPDKKEIIVPLMSMRY